MVVRKRKKIILQIVEPIRQKATARLCFGANSIEGRLEN